MSTLMRSIAEEGRDHRSTEGDRDHSLAIARPADGIGKTMEVNLGVELLRLRVLALGAGKDEETKFAAIVQEVLRETYLIPLAIALIDQVACTNTLITEI